jgi:hypothetical protein
LIRRAIAACLLLIAVAVPSVFAQKPRIDYSSYVGGSGDEWAYAVATDSSGNIYIAGFTESSDLPLVNPLQRSYGGGTGDLFIAKLKADGSGFAYLTYIGGAGGEGDIAGYVGGIAVDAQGNAYVAGVTRSSDFPTTPGAFQTAIGSQFACDDDPNAGLCGDAFLLKLSSDGSRLIYSTYLGGSDYDDAKAIAIDSQGNAYVTGITASVDFPTTAGAFQSQLHDVDAYVAKLSPDGSKLVYSTLIGGTGLDAGMSIAVDSAGRAYVGGTTQAADFPVKQSLQPQFNGLWDAFVLRLNADGSNLDFSTLLGGQGTDEALGIALGPSGDIYVAGFTDSLDFPLKNSFQPVLGGTAGNGFVTRIKSDGSSILYSSYLGGADGRSQLDAIAVDGAGDVYVAGEGGSDFAIVNSAQAYGGSSDAVVAKLTPDGSGLLFSTFVGGSGGDIASGLTLDTAGRIAIVGQTASPDFPLSGNAFQTTLSGSTDAFITRITLPSASAPIFSSPKLIQLGESYAGQASASQVLTISNPGTQPLLITSVASSTNVHAVSNCSSVSPGGNCLITANFTSVVPGDQSGTISVYDNAPDSPQTIYIRASGISGGDLELSSLVTGASFVSSGKTTFPVTATVIDHGPADSPNITVSITNTMGTVSCNPCAVGTLKSGASAVAHFNFVPSAYGMIALTANAQASDGAPDLNPANNSQTVSIANPRYAVGPAQLNFNLQTVGLASTAQTITFNSLDQKPLQLSFSTSGDFSASTSCDAGALRCYAAVTFLPTGAGSRYGSLVVTESLGETVQAIPLSGTGQLAPHLKLSDTELLFVTSVTGQLGPTRILSVTNDGSAQLFLNQIGIIGSFVQTNMCPPWLAPASSCQIAVSFMAGEMGPANGTLTIYSNAPELFDVVTLSGMGVPLLTPQRPSRPTPPASSPSAPSAPSAAPIASAPISPVRPVPPIILATTTHKPRIDSTAGKPTPQPPRLLDFTWPIILQCDGCAPPECSQCKQE